MKGKITIVLLGLALVFGMIAASCDNGAYPAVDNKDEKTLFAYDGTATNDSPNIPLKLYKGTDLYNLLAIKIPNPDPTKPGTYIPQFMLAKTGAVRPGLDDGVAGTDGNGDSLTVAQAKSRYAGMPIIINNLAVGSSNYVTPVPAGPNPDPSGDPQGWFDDTTGDVVDNKPIYP
jgi:hypothetical protein